jgi:hypothetical protein
MKSSVLLHYKYAGYMLVVKDRCHVGVVRESSHYLLEAAVIRTADCPIKGSEGIGGELFERGVLVGEYSTVQ